MHDTRLKKNEVKVTVIATGFPNGMQTKSSSLFQMKDRDADDGKKSSGKIYNTATEAKKDSGKKSVDDKKSDQLKDDDDDWGGVPAFLRRSKLK